MATPTAVRALEYWAYQYRRTWRSSIVSSFLNPVLFLAAMGLGLGRFVDDTGGGAIGGVDYVVFLAPGLLAATCMQTSATESSFPVVGAIKWLRTYHGMLATPLGVRDILARPLGMDRAAGDPDRHRVHDRDGAVRRRPLPRRAARHPGRRPHRAGLQRSRSPPSRRGPPTTTARSTRCSASASCRCSCSRGRSSRHRSCRRRWRRSAWAVPLWHGVDLCRDLALDTITPLGDLGHAAYLLRLGDRRVLARRARLHQEAGPAEFGAEPKVRRRADGAPADTAKPDRPPH